MTGRNIERRAYAEMYGPTTGDRVRLGDTALVIEVERDHTVYGEEVKFGGGKVIRDGMGQSQARGAVHQNRVRKRRKEGTRGGVPTFFTADQARALPCTTRK